MPNNKQQDKVPEKATPRVDRSKWTKTAEARITDYTVISPSDGGSVEIDLEGPQASYNRGCSAAIHERSLSDAVKAAVALLDPKEVKITGWVTDKGTFIGTPDGRVPTLEELKQ